MQRIRTIKPQFWEDEKVGALPLPCRLLFIGCLNFADDQGVIRASPLFIKSKIFPYDEHIRTSQIKIWLECLEKARMIVPIIHEEESYYVIRTFRNHQVIDKRYSKFIIPQEIIDNLLNSLCNLRGITSQEMEMEVEKEREKEEREKPKKIATGIAIKEKESDDSTLSPEYLKFLSWLQQNAPYCAKNMDMITESQMMKLKAKYTSTEISDTILKIENRKDLRKKYISLYRTVLNWLKKEYGNSHITP